MKRVLETNNCSTVISLEGMTVTAVITSKVGEKPIKKVWKLKGKVEAQETFARIVKGCQMLESLSPFVRLS